MAGREGRRGECQTGLGFVWHETGALRNARPSRGQAASTRSRRKCRKRQRSLPFELTDGCYRWEVSTQEALTVILNAVPVAFSTDRQSAGGCLPVVCAAGMNPAHGWHTTLVRERGFAVGLGMHSFTSEKPVSRDS